MKITSDISNVVLRPSIREIDVRDRSMPYALVAGSDETQRKSFVMCGNYAQRARTVHIRHFCDEHKIDVHCDVRPDGGFIN